MQPNVFRYRTPATFGTASFMERPELISLKLQERGEGATLCPYVGGLASGNAPGDRVSTIYARAVSAVGDTDRQKLTKSNGHLLTVAPSRAGKGTGQIIPNLLRWTGSVLVLDVKGENYLQTAGCRQNKLGQRVLRFAPFEEASSVWNPLMSIRANPGARSTPVEEEDARYLTNLLVPPSGVGSDEFWENSAKNFLEGLLLFVRTKELRRDPPDPDDPEDCCLPRERSMAEVRRLLTLDDEGFDALLTTMGHSSRTLIAQAGNALKRQMKGDGKTGISIMSVALERTSVWGYTRLQKVTHKAGEDGEPAANDFSFSDLRDGNTSLYLIIPPDYLTEYRSVLRVMIGMAMRELRMSYKTYANKDVPPVLFLLDEFPQLAYMRPIEEALLYLAGYGVRFWFFVQDTSQLQTHYKNSWRTFFANTGTQCFFGVSDIATANLVSEMAGSSTVHNLSYGGSATMSSGDSGSRAFGSSSSSSTSWSASGGGSSETEGSSETYTTGWNSSLAVGSSRQLSYVARRLIMPDEVLRMHDQEQIIFMKGLKPIRATRVPWHAVDQLIELGNLSPPQEVDFA